MELDRACTCCFSGHRPDKLPSGYRELPEAIAPVKAALSAAIDEAITDGYNTFLCGMAQGVDLWAAEEILRRRKSETSLRLIAALPLPGAGRPLALSPARTLPPPAGADTCRGEARHLRQLHPLLYERAQSMDGRTRIPTDRRVRRQHRRYRQHGAPSGGASTFDYQTASLNRRKVVTVDVTVVYRSCRNRQDHPYL